MDVELFSEMLRELILDNDEVTLPGLGTFVSEVMPASFSDRGYTINPPYRRLGFRQRCGNDSKLVDFYATTNGTEKTAAETIVSGFLDSLKMTLKTRKVVVFPGLGRLKATKENAFFFISEEDLQIYPYGFGLEPVSLKTHVETGEAVSASLADLRALVDIPAVAETERGPSAVSFPEVPDTAKETFAVASSVAESATEGASTVKPLSKTAGIRSRKRKRKMRKRRSFQIVLMALALLTLLAALAFVLFILLARVAPDFVDSLLYTSEELRIIRS